MDGDTRYSIVRCGQWLRDERGDAKRIFEPFFTTKENKGTGLGLWVSSEIIAKHNGTVRVASRAAEEGERKAVRYSVHAFFP